MQKKKNAIVLVCLILLSVPGALAQQLVQVVNLRANSVQNPKGLDQSPIFSWELTAKKHNVVQKSYRVKVNLGSQLVWDSGIVKANTTNNVAYKGPALRPSTVYSWKVEVETNISKGISSTEKASFETGLLNSGWDGAAWIAYDNIDSAFKYGKQTDLAVMFRSEFQITKKIRSAKLYTTSLGMHDLFINGKRLGHHSENGHVSYDELKPGWTDVSKRAYYLSYDVSDYLLPETNAIGAYVASGWASGAIAYDRYKNPSPSYMAKLMVTYTDGTSKTLVTNANDWKSSLDGAIRMADIYAGEDYDARYTDEWTRPNFDDSKWRPVKSNPYFKGELVAHIGVPVRERKDLERLPSHIVVYSGTKPNGTDHGEINITAKYQKASVLVLKKGETAILDFGQNLVGWTPFTAKGPRGTQITIRYAEMLNDSGSEKRGNDGAKGTLYRRNLRKTRASINYTMSGSPEGEYYQPSMTWFGFRYAAISADADIEIQEISAAVISSVEKERSNFVTSDKNVNQLFQNTLWGQRGNFLSVPLDCPQRNERMGWMADAQVFSRTAMYNSDATAFYEKWMGDVRDAQYTDGAYSTIAPQTWGAVGKGEAAWADAGIIVPYMVYTMSGNVKILSDNYRSMSAYMDYLKAQATAEYHYNGPGTRYGDWLAYDETDKRFLSVCYYAYDALLMSKMAGALSMPEDQQKYTLLYNDIKAEFRKRYVTGTASLSQPTQTAYLHALKLGLFDTKEETALAVKKLLGLIEANGYRLSTGFLGTAILNQTLSELGESDMAYNLLLQRNDPSWLYSVDQGATTIWERWNSYTISKGFGDAKMNSFNHYAYGAVVEWMYAYMAGIRSNGAGFRNIIIQPQLDLRKTLPAGQQRITEVAATYASINGPIKSAWKVNGNRITYNLSIPANTTATFIVPINQHSLNRYSSGVKSIKKERDNYLVELGSGNYSFTLTR